MDFTLSLPEEICAELGSRARARRIQMNLSVDEMAKRIGVSPQALSNFERTGKCTLATFTRIVEALGASADFQSVLNPPLRTIEDMRSRYALKTRRRAYRRAPKVSST